MASLEELLDGPVLSQFYDCFIEMGFDDMSFIVSMDNDEWEDMLDTVAAEAASRGLSFKPGHKMQIMARLRREKVNRSNVARDTRLQVSRAAQGVGMGAGAGAGRGLVRSGSFNRPEASPASIHNRQAQAGYGPDTTGDELATKAHVLMEGFGCLNVHWMFCFGLSMLSLGVSLFLWGLDTGLGGEFEGKSSEEDGGWEFLRILWIAGFTFACFTFCLCCLAYQRNPEDAGLGQFGDCGDMDCTPIAVCFGSVCALFSCACACCEGDPEPSSFSCPSFGACECPSLSCECPSFSAATFCPDCSMLCSLQCCPQCDGLAECCNTAYKILCCQCQIQKTGAGFVVPTFLPEAKRPMNTKPVVEAPDPAFVPKVPADDGPSKADLFLSKMPESLTADSVAINGGEAIVAPGGMADQAHDYFERTRDAVCSEATCPGGRLDSTMQPISAMKRVQDAEAAGDKIAKALHEE